MRGELLVQVERKPDQTVQVALVGSLDAHTLTRFESALTDLFEKEALWIVLDLGQMDYVSSVGVNLLIRSRVSQRQLGGDIVMARPQPHVLKIMEMLGLLGLLIVRPTLEEAWAKLHERQHARGSGLTGGATSATL